MADNFEATPGKGRVFRSDDVGGVHFQVVKLDVGADGASLPVGGALPVVAIEAVVASSFVRPADTTAYAVGDLVANHVTAGSVVPLAFAALRNATVTARLTRLRLAKSTAGLANASFRLHLYSVAPVPANGDNGALLTPLAGYIGAVDVVIDRGFSDGASGAAVASLLLSGATATIHGLIEARAAYVPGAGETFTASLELTQN